MSGELPRNQHYVPCFMLRSFGTERKKDEFFTTVYRKTHVFPSNVTGIGGERYFYNRPGENEIEARLSRQESELAPVHNELTSAPIRDPLDKFAAAKLLVHCSIRAKVLRVEVASAMDTFFEMMSEVFTDAASIKRLLLKTIEEDPSFIRETFAENVPEGVDAAWLEGIVASNPEILFDMIDFDALTGIAATIRSAEFDPYVKAREIQLRVMNDTLAPEKRIQKLLNGEIKLVELNNNRIALPDTMLIHLSKIGKLQGGFDFDEEKGATILPISPNRVLVAKPNSVKLSKSRLGDYVCRSSLEFFVFPDDVGFFKKRRKYIGSLSGSLLSNMLDFEFRTKLGLR